MSRPAPPPLHPVQYLPALRRALREDLGRAGDMTADAIVPPELQACARLVPRVSGCVAGLDVAAAAFRLLDERCDFERAVSDGDSVGPAQLLARVRGAARALLSAERTALNFLARMSGVATATRRMVDAVAGYPARVVCTRKTTPGLRALEKYAVRVGGGANHRFGLDDAVLIKDNHLAIAGSVTEAVARVRRTVGHMVKVEVEVDTLEQLEEALRLEVDAALLDNMSLDELRNAVAMTNRRLLLEASGGIDPERARQVAATGVDLISAGWITHSAPALDVALDLDS